MAAVLEFEDDNRFREPAWELMKGERVKAQAKGNSPAVTSLKHGEQGKENRDLPLADLRLGLPKSVDRVRHYPPSQNSRNEKYIQT